MAKKLIFILILVVLLGALGLTLTLLGKDTPAASSPVPNLPDIEYLVNFQGDEFEGIASVLVKNNTGEYIVLGGDSPSIAGYESLISNTYPLFRITNLAAALVSRGLVVEDGADLAVYGLDQPRAEVQVQPNKGSGAVLYIGNNAPDGISVYLRKEGDPAVYQAGRGDAETFMQGIFDFVDKQVSPQLEDDGYGGFEFERITLGGTVRPDGIVTVIYQSQENVQTGRIKTLYRVAGPQTEGSLNMDKGYNALKAISGISADKAVARVGVNTWQELAPFGLDKPYSTVSISGIVVPDGNLVSTTPGQSRGSFSLRSSKPDSNGNVYMYREGTELVYQVAAANLTWLEVSWWDLMERLIILPFIDDIAQVEVNTPARSVAFKLDGESDELIVEAHSTAPTQNVVVDTAFFRSYYQTLLTALYEEYTEERPSAGAKPFLEIVYNYRDGHTPDRVSFYSTASRRVLVSLNGGRPFYTFSAYTDKVLADLDRILGGQKVLPYL